MSICHIDLYITPSLEIWGNRMIRKGLVVGIIVLFVGASVVPIISGNTNNISHKKSSLEVVNIFGFFPQQVGDVIIYLSLYPFGWKTIYKDYFTKIIVVKQTPKE